MMSPPVTIGGGPAVREPRPLLGFAVALAAAASAALAVGVTHDAAGPPPAALVERWIDAWNSRDPRAVSSLTCDYLRPSVPAGVVDQYLAATPRGRPVVADHVITGIEPGVAHDRRVERVLVTYVSGAREGLLRTSVFVRVRGDDPLCVGAFTAW
jgi:hypothetical protein